MKAYKEIEKNPTRAEQIKAGATILIGLGLFGALQYFFKQRVMAAEIMWAIGGVAFVASLLPGVGRYLYIGWMGLGVTIGIFTQPIVITIAYVLLFVPLGLLFRILGRDMMKRKLADKSVASYWEDCDEPAEPEMYFKQY